MKNVSQNINKLFILLLFIVCTCGPQDPQCEEGEVYKGIYDPDEDDRDEDDRDEDRSLRYFPKGSVIVILDDEAAYLRHSQYCRQMYQHHKPQWYQGRSVAGEDREFRNEVTNSQP